MNFFSEGFFLGLSLIVAIGAQNAFVLRQGIRKEHQFVTALLCTMIDAALITAGSLGLGTVIASMPILLKTVTVFGAAFVAWYGAQAFIRHLSGSHSGVMGLPMFETARLLRQAGVGA